MSKMRKGIKPPNLVLLLTAREIQRSWETRCLQRF
jgi:hypothetical protein